MLGSVEHRYVASEIWCVQLLGVVIVRKGVTEYDTRVSEYGGGLSPRNVLNEQLPTLCMNRALYDKM